MMGKVHYSGHDLHGKTVEIVGEDNESLSHVPMWLIKPPWPLGPYAEGDEWIGLPKANVRVLAEKAA